MSLDLSKNGVKYHGINNVDKIEYDIWIHPDTITIDNDKSLYGHRHRFDGPAYINSHGSQSWWFNNKLHRIGGPAVICSEKDRRIYGPLLLWWINGEEYTFKEYCEKVKSLIPEDDYFIMILTYGSEA